MKCPRLESLRWRILKEKDEPNRMKNQRDISKILTGPFILAHPIDYIVLNKIFLTMKELGLKL